MPRDIFFSIIIPTYNRAELLRKTLESFIQQEFRDFEVLVIDDGGSDHSRGVVEALNDPRFQYHFKENAERGAARNFGARLARGNYVNFFDSDDLAYPHFLKIGFDTVEQLSFPEIFALSYEIFDTNGKRLNRVILPHPTRDHIYKGNHFGCDSVFVQRDVALQYPFIEDRELAGSEDFELWLRLAARFPWPVSSEVVFKMINHSGRSTLNFEEAPLVKRKELMLHYAFSDPQVVRVFGKYRRRMQADALRYIALHLVLSGKKRGAFKYLLKSILTNPGNLFHRSNFAILRRLLLM